MISRQARCSSATSTGTRTTRWPTSFKSGCRSRKGASTGTTARGHRKTRHQHSSSRRITTSFLTALGRRCVLHTFSACVSVLYPLGPESGVDSTSSGPPRPGETQLKDAQITAMKTERSVKWADSLSRLRNASSPTPSAALSDGGATRASSAGESTGEEPDVHVHSAAGVDSTCYTDEPASSACGFLKRCCSSSAPEERLKGQHLFSRRFRCTATEVSRTLTRTLSRTLTLTLTLTWP